MKNAKLLLCLALLALLAACGKNGDLIVRESDDNLEEHLLMLESLKDDPLKNDYSRQLPAYLRAIGMNARQPDHFKAGLGRVLFYDKNLSKDRSVSCASCHKPSRAFSDGAAFSTGVEGRKTARNSMPLANVVSFSAHYDQAAGGPHLFWDDRAPSVAEQSRQTFANPDEMGMEMADVVSRVKEQDYYRYPWKQVYGDAEVTADRVLECLSEFVGAMGGHNSKLDKALVNATDINATTTFDTVTGVVVVFHAYSGDTILTTTNTVVVNGLPGFNLSENRGRDLFIANCSKCHSPLKPFQEVFQACNGLDMNYTDQGIGMLTGNPADMGVFKAPSLRNIAHTAPYMHDGRFNTLAEVVNFYSDGVKQHPNLHPLMLHNGDPNLHFTATQKQDLINFLHTLTDMSIATDPRFSNPFK